ncbi:ABC transporter permease [Kiloniella litopenaei]|uniref:ABC transporter permease n=1 Tax=Kiloniella litopenaei TaxID=1549748 RepID=UPI003BAB9A6C
MVDLFNTFLSPEIAGWAQQFGRALVTTCLLAICGFVLALVLGSLGAVAQVRGGCISRYISIAYVECVRGIPEILLILFIYYGGGALITTFAKLLGYGSRVDFDAFTAGILALGFVSGGFAVEILRAAWGAVPRGQSECAAALGLRPVKAFVLVIAPQMLRIALPPLGNLWVTTVKETALISVIGLSDMVRIANVGAGATGQPFVFYAVVGLLFLALAHVSNLVISHVEMRQRRWSHPQ